MKHSKNLLPPFEKLGLPSRHAATLLRTYKATVGFDGFLDTITKVIKKTGTDTEQVEYFDSLSGFGSYLAEHDHMNCSLELETCSERFGGNAPLLANALGALGARVECYGTFGESQLHPAFRDLHCRLHSFGNASQSLALEFKDGKLFLGRNSTIPHPFWEHLISCKECQELCRDLTESELIALVNWSELDYSHDLWEQVYWQCLDHEATDKSRYVFFDLCDIARKSDAQVMKVLALTSLLSQKRYTVLSLNQNEVLRVGSCIGKEKDIPQICRLLLQHYGLDEVIVHTRNCNSLHRLDKKTIVYTTEAVDTPAVLTGAGDHFNAACCAALLLQVSCERRLQFATEYASCYIRTGQVPVWDDCE